jgi:sterol desaturase/sphingolipid hydroxylase (fatty acid hydroxylase superfamily)
MLKSMSLKTLVSFVAYPLILTLGVAQYLALVSAGLPLQASSYGTVLLAALLITVLENYFPHKDEWKGTRDDIRTDLTYMMTIQLALPTLLGLSLALYLKNQTASMGLQISTYWPHHWPVGFQVILMLFTADFFRYWLHRASHTYTPLWRLHAVHHSPHKLYWINVGRFHPLDKTLQYLFDALPFILLNVSNHVLALYLVFYAINGFFQHSNVALRFGPLNYVISTAELHRWHHSWLTRESNNNYGNNLIIWDWLFGTRFLPPGRAVEALGLQNRDYPLSFFEQFKSPFLTGLEKKDSPQLTWYDLILNLLMQIRMARLKYTEWQRITQKAQDPEKVQDSVLIHLIRENQETRFGRDYGFQKIKSWDDFANRVPIQTYETLRPYIERQEGTEEPQLTKEAPVLYAQTSGTTGTPKYIPVPQRAFQRYKNNQNLISYIQYRDAPGAYSGKFLVIASPAIEGYLESGIPFGSISGSLYKNLPIYLKAKYVLPPEVFEIKDYETKYLLMVRLAIAQKNITSMASANPTTFLKLLEILNHHREELALDIQQEAFSRLRDLPDSLCLAIAPHLGCSVSRKRQLEKLLLRDNLGFIDLWPYLKLLTTWTGGSCGIALGKIRASLPGQTRIGELGYVSTEFRGSFPINLETNQCLPTFTENFFEFVPKEDWEKDRPTFLRLHQLTQGQDYYVFVTTPSGLYRYNMNDIVRVSGFFHNTPTIEFIQKGKGVTNLTGEKLYENQVIQAVKHAEQDLGILSHFYVFLADTQNMAYHLLIEFDQPTSEKINNISEVIEKYLKELNIEYAQKRSSGRLHQLCVTTLQTGTREAHKRYCLEQGQREGQFKTLILQYKEDFHFPYQRYILPDSSQS